MKKTLYSKDSGSRVRLWTVIATGRTVEVISGILGGKMVSRKYEATYKNVGKANEVDPEAQAVIEAEAKYVKQLKSGYFETIEEAMKFVEFTPMKAQNYNDHSHKLVYPCYEQPKLNGQRLMIDAKGDAWTKQGERVTLPKHWTGVREYAIKVGGLDGEVYAGLGVLSLQQIRSAFVKENENTPKLSYWIYDLPIEGTMEERADKMLSVLHSGANNIPRVIVPVPTAYVENEEQANALYWHWVAQGYEGSCYRNVNGVYEFGKRSYDLLKRKPRQTAEAKVVRVEKDKNKNGVCTCQDFLSGVEFKLLMRKDSHDTINFREYDNALTLLDKVIEYEYEEHSDAGVPTKPVGIGIREVNSNGQPLI